ncbi:MAG: hypothetical protein QGI83_07895 [Candidatus Latescibacteria bacterium]|jgi:hypothetical protein|nr:hypothetical protein [Candidatus Latescibacterota bacterium]
MGDVVLAQIDLKGCPEGLVFDLPGIHWGIEDRYLPDWECPLARVRQKGRGASRPSYWRVLEEDGRPVLDHFNMTDRPIVVGDFLWRDYTIEGHVRQMVSTSEPNSDDPFCFVGRSGLILRYQTLGQYYFFCIEGFDRLVLYRREHAHWHVLDELTVPVDRSCFHHLKAECLGNRITCSFDGQQCFVANDSAYETGRAGIRTCTRAQFHDVRVTASAAANAAFVDTRSRYEKEVAAEREKYPKPVLWREIDTNAFGGGVVLFGDIRGSGETELLLFQDPSSGDDAPRIRAVNLQGEQAWEMAYPNLKTVAPRRTAVQDIDGDGVQELVSVGGNRLSIVNAMTGELKTEAPLPDPGPFLVPRGQPLTDEYLHVQRAVMPCNLRGHPDARDFILRDGISGGSGWTIWAYDQDLNLLWRQRADAPWYGHSVYFHDVDGDGRDEVLSGYHLYDDDGRPIWRMEGAEYLPMGDHVDNVVFGEIDGDEGNGPEIGIAGSSSGFYFVDARDGRVQRKYRMGHTQDVYAGNFRPDLPGLEMWAGDRWDSYGLLVQFSGTAEPLLSLEPDNESQSGPAVNWGGDGQELLLLSTTYQALGMFDGFGRKVVEFPYDELGLPGGRPFFRTWTLSSCMDLTGDARDEVVLNRDGVYYIYTQDTPYPKGERIYAPVRNGHLSAPGWITNDVS